MTASVTRSARALGSTGTTSTASITAPTPGNTLLVEVIVPTASAPVTPATALQDNLGNVFDLDHSGGGAWGSRTIYFYRKSNISNAPTSISMNGSSSFTAVFQVIEVTGLDNTAPLVRTVAKTDLSDGVSQPAHVASVDTVNANDFVLIATNGSNGDPLSTASNGFSVVQTPVYDDMLFAAYLADAGSAGTKTTTLTFSGGLVALFFAVVYKSVASGPTVTSVTSSGVTEGGNMVFTVTLSGATSGSTNYAFSLGGTATAGTDYTSPLTSGMCNNGVTVSGGDFVVPDATSSWTVTVPTTQDALDEDNETIVLTVGGTASTGGTITDDDAPPTVSISDATESFGTVTHTLTLSQASSKTITVQVDSANGSKTAGTHYTAVTAQTVTFNPGETEQTVQVTVL